MSLTTPPGRLFTYETLPDKGIRFTSEHIRKLIRQKKFPAPSFYLGLRTPTWTERVLDTWISEREAAHARGDDDAALEALSQSNRAAALTRHRGKR